VITYQIEKYSDVVPELAILYPEHYKEVEGPIAVGEELDLDWDQYKNLDNAGMIQLVTCRIDGELIGYILYIISRHLHVKSCLTAYEDIYFLRKQHRKGRTGIKLFQFAEQHLKSLHVNKILCSTKVHQDNSKLFEYLGYSFIEKLFSKYI